MELQANRQNILMYTSSCFTAAPVCQGSARHFGFSAHSQAIPGSQDRINEAYFCFRTEALASAT